MVIEQAFDFRRINILAAADNHIFGSPQNPQAFLVEFHDIAGGGPALRIENRGGQFFVAIVAGRRVGTSKIQDAGFTIGNRLVGVLVEQIHLVARQHAADGPAAKIFGILHPASGNRSHVLGAQVTGNIGTKCSFSFFGNLR